MSKVYRLVGIIIRRQNTGTVDRRITILSERGKAELKARGTQKLSSKLAGSLEPITMVDVTVAHGRAIDHIIGSSIRHSYRRLRQSVPMIAAASLLLSVADVLIRGPLEDDRPYEDIRRALDQLEHSRTNVDVFLLLLQTILRLLTALGFLPTAHDLSPRSDVQQLYRVLLRMNDGGMIPRPRAAVLRTALQSLLDFTEQVAERPVSARPFFTQAFLA